MSLVRVLDLLVSFEGEASTRELADRARARWPRDTLHQYVKNRLNQLVKWRFVELLPEPGAQVWRITDAGRAWLAREQAVVA